MKYHDFPVCCQKFERRTRAVAHDVNLSIHMLEGFLYELPNFIHWMFNGESIGC